MNIEAEYRAVLLKNKVIHYVLSDIAVKDHGCPPWHFKRGDKGHAVNNSHFDHSPPEEGFKGSP
jgi:hypothetical protein